MIALFVSAMSGVCTRNRRLRHCTRKRGERLEGMDEFWPAIRVARVVSALTPMTCPGPRRWPSQRYREKMVLRAGTYVLGMPGPQMRSWTGMSESRGPADAAVRSTECPDTLSAATRAYHFRFHAGGADRNGPSGVKLVTETARWPRHCKNRGRRSADALASVGD